MLRSSTSGRRSGTLRVAGLAGVLCLAGTMPASATHFRGGQIAALPVPGHDGNDVVFTIQGAWRIVDAKCVDPRTVSSAKDCSGEATTTGGAKPPKAGDVVQVNGEIIANHDPDDTAVLVDFGDDLGTLSPNFLVTYVDTTNGWFLGLAIDRNAIGASTELGDLMKATLIRHSYLAPGRYQVSVSGCCRLASFVAPNKYYLNAERRYKVLATVTVGSGNVPPMLGQAPVVNCLAESNCGFQVGGNEVDGDHATFTLASSAQSDSLVQPGAQHPAAVSASGAYSWDTTGEQPDPNFNNLYSTQVVLTGGESIPGDAVSADFLVQVIGASRLPPYFEGSSCGTAIKVAPGVTAHIDVKACDDLTAETGKCESKVTLDAAALPAGATMSTALPIKLAQGPSSTFSWTPSDGQVGVSNLQFVATDGGGNVTFCPVSIVVRECVEDSDCTDELACTADRCDAGRCAHTPDDNLCGPPTADCTGMRCEPNDTTQQRDAMGCVASELDTDECCGDCIDNDHDGRVDLEDPDCCVGVPPTDAAKYPPLHHQRLGKTRKARRSGRIKLSARMDLLLRDAVASGAPLWFYLRKSDQPPMCIATEASSWSGDLDSRRGRRLLGPTGPLPPRLVRAKLRKTNRNRVELKATAEVGGDVLRSKGPLGLTAGARGLCVRAGRFTTP